MHQQCQSSLHCCRSQRPVYPAAPTQRGASPGKRHTRDPREMPSHPYNISIVKRVASRRAAAMPEEIPCCSSPEAAVSLPQRRRSSPRHDRSRRASPQRARSRAGDRDVEKRCSFRVSDAADTPEAPSGHRTRRASRSQRKQTQDAHAQVVAELEHPTFAPSPSSPPSLQAASSVTALLCQLEAEASRSLSTKPASSKLSRRGTQESHFSHVHGSGDHTNTKELYQALFLQALADSAVWERRVHTLEKAVRTHEEREARLARQLHRTRQALAVLAAYVEGVERVADVVVAREATPARGRGQSAASRSSSELGAEPSGHSQASATAASPSPRRLPSRSAVSELLRGSLGRSLELACSAGGGNGSSGWNEELEGIDAEPQSDIESKVKLVRASKLSGRHMHDEDDEERHLIRRWDLEEPHKVWKGDGADAEERRYHTQAAHGSHALAAPLATDLPAQLHPMSLHEVIGQHLPRVALRTNHLDAPTLPLHNGTCSLFSAGGKDSSGADSVAAFITEAVDDDDSAKAAEQYLLAAPEMKTSTKPTRQRASNAAVAATASPPFVMNSASVHPSGASPRLETRHADPAAETQTTAIDVSRAEAPHDICPSLTASVAQDLLSLMRRRASSPRPDEMTQHATLGAVPASTAPASTRESRGPPLKIKEKTIPSTTRLQEETARQPPPPFHPSTFVQSPTSTSTPSLPRSVDYEVTVNDGHRPRRTETSAAATAASSTASSLPLLDTPAPSSIAAEARHAHRTHRQRREGHGVDAGTSSGVASVPSSPSSTRVAHAPFSPSYTGTTSEHSRDQGSSERGVASGPASYSVHPMQNDVDEEDEVVAPIAAADLIGQGASWLSGPSPLPHTAALSQPREEEAVTGERFSRSLSEKDSVVASREEPHPLSGVDSVQQRIFVDSYSSEEWESLEASNPSDATTSTTTTMITSGSG